MNDPAKDLIAECKQLIEDFDIASTSAISLQLGRIIEEAGSLSMLEMREVFVYINKLNDSLFVRELAEEATRRPTYL